MRPSSSVVKVGMKLEVRYIQTFRAGGLYTINYRKGVVNVAHICGPYTEYGVLYGVFRRVIWIGKVRPPAAS